MLNAIYEIPAKVDNLSQKERGAEYCEDEAEWVPHC